MTNITVNYKKNTIEITKTFEKKASVYLSLIHISIPVIETIDDRIRQLAGGAGSDKGTGGMFTKVSAADIATSAGIDVHIVYGKKPDLIYDVLDGKRAGTVFKKKKQEN